MEIVLIIDHDTLGFLLSQMLLGSSSSPPPQALMTSAVSGCPKLRVNMPLLMSHHGDPGTPLGAAAMKKCCLPPR